MATDMSLIFDNVGDVLEAYSDVTLPKWEDLPDIPLYMDQVIGLMERYLDIGGKVAENALEKDAKILTSSMVNNYVKMGIMPAPVKKKYDKEHLAYLLMICILKQSLSISVIGVFIQTQVDSMGVEAFYKLFIKYYKEFFDQYVNELIEIHKKIFHSDTITDSQQAVMGIVAAACANAGKLTVDTADVIINNVKEEDKKAKEKEKEKAEKDKKKLPK